MALRRRMTGLVPGLIVTAGSVMLGYMCTLMFSRVAPVPPRVTPVHLANAIPDGAPHHKLLPTPPPLARVAGPILSDDVKLVPEVELQAQFDKTIPVQEQAKQMALQLANISRLNGEKTDGFMTELLASRDDLAGLPFAMGELCRSSPDRAKQLVVATATVREGLRLLGVSVNSNVNTTITFANKSGKAIKVSWKDFDGKWNLYRTLKNGESYEQKTYLTHLWLITDENDNVWYLYLPEVQPRTIEITAPNMFATASRESQRAAVFWHWYASSVNLETQATRDRAAPTPAQAAATSRIGTTEIPSISDESLQESIAVARIAALMQILAAESSEMRVGLARHLSTIQHVEATKALAQMAIFSAEVEVRTAAIHVLKSRPKKDSTDILLRGLRYPWPAVAERSAEAIARLERSDLIPDLVAVLDAEDPRMPTVNVVDGRPVAKVRELVKVNHHRNCIMCHAPAATDRVTTNLLEAPVPLPSQPLLQPSEYYRQSSPGLFVRFDVTYLRQDFSVKLPVPNADPWPERQRFDFFVRERQLTSEEANDYRMKLTPKEEGVLSPYREASLAALRELTGKDTVPTAEAWRKLLDLPTSQ